MAHFSPVHINRFQLAGEALKSMRGRSLTKKIANIMFAIYWIFVGHGITITPVL